jgi:tetratricopeptide (TPR) repeat protein
MKLGAVYCYTEQLDLGMKEFDELHAMDPADEQVVTIRAILKSGLASRDDRRFLAIIGKVLRDKQITKLIPEFNRSVRIEPEVSEMISVVMSMSEEDRTLCETLIPLVKDHITEHGDYPDLHNSLGTLYLKLDRPGEAEASFIEALRINPRYLLARLNLFYAQKALGKDEKALSQAAVIRAAEISYPDFYCSLAEIHLTRGEFGQTEENAAKALELNPSLARARYCLAKAFAGKGETSKALRHLRKCLEMSPPADIYRMAEKDLHKLEEP